MINYSNFVVLLSFLGALIAAFFKHFWIIAMILLILIIFKVLSYPIDKDQNQN